MNRPAAMLASVAALAALLLAAPAAAQTTFRANGSAALPAAPAAAASALQRFFQPGGAGASAGPARLVSFLSSGDPASVEYQRRAQPFVQALAEAGVAAQTLSLDVEGNASAIAAALERAEKGLQTTIEKADALRGDGAEAEEQRAQAWVLREQFGALLAQRKAETVSKAALKTAETLASLLGETADDDDAAASLAVRMKQAAKRFKDDAAATVLIEALAKRLPDMSGDEEEKLRAAIEEAGYAAQGDGARIAATKALLKEADDEGEMGDGDAVLARAMRLMDYATAEAKLAVAKHLRELADEPSEEWDKGLVIRAERLEDDAAWDEHKHSPDTAVMHALAEQLREADGEDATAAAVARIDQAWPSASGPAQELAARALGRNLAAAARRGDWDETIAKALEEVGNMSAWKGVAELAADGFEDAIQATDDEEIQKRAREAANRVLGVDKAARAAPPAPASAASRPEGKSGLTPWGIIQAGLAVSGLIGLLRLLF